jgi:uncharacterized membrane protein
VFAIAVTLLALDLKVLSLPNGMAVPGLTSTGLGAALARQWPSYMASITSFFSVLIMWVNHHAIFRIVCRVNVRLLLANGLLLMVATIAPFSTNLVAEYFRTPGGRLACLIYGGTFLLGSIAFNLTWYVITHDPGLLRHDAPESMIIKIMRSYRNGVPIYLVAMLGAFISVYVTMGICTALWIY